MLNPGESDMELANSNNNPSAIQFTGNARDYFGIWIVNILLSLITLGIYSAWATVRSKKYFYQNTKVFGSSFDFHASPLTILKGRVIAVLAYLAFVVASRSSPHVAVLLPLLLVLFVPLLVVRALRFRLSNTSYRGIRFGFDGKTSTSYMVNLLIPLLAIPTAGLALPYVSYKWNEFWVSNLRYGKEKFKSEISVKRFYAIYAQLLAIVAGVVYAAYLLSKFLQNTLTHEQFLSIVSFLPVAFMLLIWLLVAPFLTARVSNHLYGSMSVAGASLKCEMEFGKLFWLRVSNFVLIACSFGLLVPFARIRNVRYLASSMDASLAGSLDDVMAAASPATGATGEQIAEIFDLDIPVA